MVPTLRHGDALLVVRTRRARPGDVVIARFRSRPDLVVVKRVDHLVGDGWWLTSDNSFVGDDSRRYGSAEVLGRVLLRWWPVPGLVCGNYHL
jgi:phage repressor protein C with HTH and peptisase S24 domain